MTRPSRIYAVGYFGMGNFGDDLFAEVARTVLWPGADVRTFVPDHLGAGSQLTVSGQAVRAARTLAGLAWCDTVAECGGSVLSRLSGTARLRQQLGRGRARLALGVSVGPFASGADEARVLGALDALDRLVVRDPASVARAGRPAELGGDLAALSERVRPAAQRSDKVTFCPSHAAGTPVTALSDRLSRALVAAGSPPVRLLALNHHPRIGDEAICTELAGRLRASGLKVATASYGDLGLDGTVRALADSAAVWSERLHGGIVAYLAGVPFALAAHHAKCADFADDIGLPDECLVDVDGPWDEAAAATLSGALVAAMAPDDYRARARGTYLGAS